MSTTAAQEAEAFTGKWRQRWPEWTIAEAFVPASSRRLAVAWFTLLQEFADAAWGGADPAPGLAKLAWWHEELEGWAAGARRHPLGAILQSRPAPWSRLGRALSALPATRGQGAAPALDALAELAAAVHACDTALFPEQSRRPGEGGGRAAGFALLAERALLTAGRDDAGWLLANWPRPPGAVLPRRLHDALLRGRLRMLARGKPVARLAGWSVLATSWRASRGR